MYLNDPENSGAVWVSIGIRSVTGEYGGFTKRERKFIDGQDIL